MTFFRPAIFLLIALCAVPEIARSSGRSDQDRRLHELEAKLLELEQSRYLDLPAVCNGRLTLTSGTPVTTSDVTGATAIYFTPYKGAKVSLFDGTQWKLFSFSELSLALGTLTSDVNYDVFLYNNAGVLTLELSAAWASATTRTDALVLQDGIYVKSGATTRRYLGTFRTVSTTATEDSAAKRFLFSYYHQVARTLFKSEATDSWTYNTNSWRATNGNTGNRVQLVIGIVGPTLALAAHFYSHSTTNRLAAYAIAEDSVTTPHASCMGRQAINLNQNTFDGYSPGLTTLRIAPAIGFHFYQWIETSFGGTLTLSLAGTADYRTSGIAGELIPG